MGNKLKLFLKTFIVCCISFAIFVGAGYYYLSKSFTQADNEALKVPYSQTLSENKGILLICGSEKVFIYLDFLENRIIVSLSPESSQNGEIYGYRHDYTIEGNDVFITNIIDCVGGVELIIEEKKLRYTGYQVSELLKKSNSLTLRREIITETTKRIAEFGVGNDFLSTIINNSKTELKFSECSLWREFLPLLCANLHFVD